MLCYNGTENRYINIPEISWTAVPQLCAKFVCEIWGHLNLFLDLSSASYSELNSVILLHENRALTDRASEVSWISKK